MCAHTDVNKNNKNNNKIYGIEHDGHQSKMSSTSKAVFHFRYIISFVCSTNMSKHFKNKQYFTYKLIFLLFTEGIGIGYFTRYKNGESNTELLKHLKSASIFQIMHKRMF